MAPRHAVQRQEIEKGEEELRPLRHVVDGLCVERMDGPNERDRRGEVEGVWAISGLSAKHQRPPHARSEAARSWSEIAMFVECGRHIDSLTRVSRPSSTICRPPPIMVVRRSAVTVRPPYRQFSTSTMIIERNGLTGF